MNRDCYLTFRTPDGKQIHHAPLTGDVRVPIRRDKVVCELGEFVVVEVRREYERESAQRLRLVLVEVQLAPVTE